MIAYLLSFKPLETPFAIKIEVMDQFSTVLLVCGFLFFAQSIEDGNYRIVTGLYYVSVIGLNFALHLCVILLGSLNSLKLLCKRRFCPQKKAKPHPVDPKASA